LPASSKASTACATFICAATTFMPISSSRWCFSPVRAMSRYTPVRPGPARRARAPMLLNRPPRRPQFPLNDPIRVFPASTRIRFTNGPES
jgi:hypothetical protein